MSGDDAREVEMARTRMDVWNRTRDEGDWPDVLKAYEVAVGRMRDLDPPDGEPPSDPKGWRFQAAIHGLQGPDGGADRSNDFWSNCQHGSWYFLPWHRMYLAAFELMVQHALEDDTWSLPYWYAIDPDDRDKAALPPAFLDLSLGDNNLQTEERSQVARSGGPFYGDIPVEFFEESLVEALGIDVYASADGISTYGGGERSDLSFNGQEPGLLENVPHGQVHVLVGNDFVGNTLVNPGWMGSFFTAGLDPIFWLHHANLDRLWQVWLDLDDDHRNPTADPAFMDTPFTFPHPTEGTVTWRIEQVLDTGFLGYDYESLAAPSVLAPPAGPDGLPRDLRPEDEMARPEPAEPPRVIGAAADVPLIGGDRVPVELTQPPSLDAADEPTAPARTYLRVEGITGTDAAPLYGVYVNVPEGDDPADHPELRAGSVSTFGLAESSRTDDDHDGEGLTATFEITALRARLLAEGRWDEERLEVSFSSHAPTPPDPDNLPGEQDVAGEPDIRARRVAVVAG